MLEGASLSFILAGLLHALSLYTGQHIDLTLVSILTCIHFIYLCYICLICTSHVLYLTNIYSLTFILTSRNVDA